MSRPLISVGIDASNIRAGGGITHLVEILTAANPLAHGIARVIVWGSSATNACLPRRDWLKAVSSAELEGPIWRRMHWQRQKLHRLLREEQCDILLVPGGNHIGSFRPFVTMFRNRLVFDMVEQRRLGLTAKRLRLWLLGRSQAETFRRAAAVIFLTESGRRLVLERVGPLRGNLPVIPHGVNPSFYNRPRPQKAMSEFTEARPFRFLYVSDLKPYKRHHELICAMGILRQGGIPATVEFVGPAEPRDLKRLNATLAGTDPDRRYACFRGEVPHAALADVYANADAFVFASCCENLPNTLIEAMASGLPIACSDREPMPEVLGERGVYFDPTMPTSIAAAMRKLVSDRDLRGSVAEAAYQRSLQYSWERCADLTLATLADAAASRAVR